jgi:hypothetical protein
LAGPIWLNWMDLAEAYIPLTCHVHNGDAFQESMPHSSRRDRDKNYGYLKKILKGLSGN